MNADKRRLVLAFLVVAALGRGEIRDVLKSAEIERRLAGTSGETAVHERPNFAIVLRTVNGKTSAAHANADEVWWVRSGQAKISLGNETLRRTRSQEEISCMCRERHSTPSMAGSITLPCASFRQVGKPVGRRGGCLMF
jgi:hypothetical protein